MGPMNAFLVVYCIVVESYIVINILKIMKR